MVTKIIGFLITKEHIVPKIDFFDVGLNIITIKHYDYNIYLWGIGNIEDYKINNKYSLSFPQHDSLLDRNILISFEGDNIIIENDWLGAIPIFYNQKDLIVSTLSIFCLKDKAIHNEGLSNFCEFGYSVFEQTMFKDIKFMRYYSKLKISDKSIDIEYKKDPILDDDFIRNNSDEKEAIILMQKYISGIENEIEGDIVLPTSGGYDSRILNYFVKDKSRIRSFTYGISKDQSKSIEVVHAKKISAIYNTKWQQIELTNFHKYIEKWFNIYGISTHLHGMYHIEFYKKILQKNKFRNATFLSGIFGDIWAGSIKYKAINSYTDVISLGYTHGMNLDTKFLKFINNDLLKKKYFNTHKDYINNDKIKPVLTIRMKLILISYLTQIPEYFGMPTWTPFLNFDIVKATLSISDEKRVNRFWQKEFFKKVGLNLEDMGLDSVRNNKLNYDVSINHKFESIDIELMQQYIDKNRLSWINNKLGKLSIVEKAINELLIIPKVGGVLRRLGFENEYLKALYEWYVIKTIEKGIKSES